jgi:uncharacterized protein with HEPN domain
MPPRKIEARLDDMVEELAGIRALLQGVSFEAYRTTWSLRRATERGLEIVAEARSLSDLSTKQEQNGALFHNATLLRNILTILCHGATYSSANLLSPTSC